MEGSERLLRAAHRFRQRHIVLAVLIGVARRFGTAAKMGYVAAVRVVSTILGNVLVWAGTPFYGLYE